MTKVIYWQVLPKLTVKFMFLNKNLFNYKSSPDDQADLVPELQ